MPSPLDVSKSSFSSWFYAYGKSFSVSYCVSEGDVKDEDDHSGVQ